MSMQSRRVAKRIAWELEIAEYVSRTGLPSGVGFMHRYETRGWGFTWGSHSHPFAAPCPVCDKRRWYEVF